MRNNFILLVTENGMQSIPAKIGINKTIVNKFIL